MGQYFIICIAPNYTMSSRDNPLPMIKKVVCLLLLSSLAWTSSLQAQDLQFSQYYAAPLYLNPALAGINQMGRAGLNYRMQWPSIDARFESFSGYVDVNFDEKNSSLGLLFTNDHAESTGLRNSEVALQYAYQVRLNHAFTFRPAAQVSYATRSIDFSNLIFGDQLDNNGITGNPTAELFGNERTNYFDLGLGGIIFSKEAWIGVAVHHVLEPDQSLAGGDDALPRKTSIHGGYKIPLSGNYRSSREVSLSPTFNYRTQADFRQLDLGAYFTISPVIFGLWYRGIPIEENNRTESLVGMIGFSKNHFAIGYSFDYTLSDLGIETGGAHEFSIAYTFKWGNKPPRSVRELQCPVPYLF